MQLFLVFIKKKKRRKVKQTYRKDYLFILIALEREFARRIIVIDNRSVSALQARSSV
jgi:hypothetical protein